MTVEPFDQRWQTVTCSGCGRTYQCTPTDDYYNTTNDQDGVCEPCLLAPHQPIEILEYRTTATIVDARGAL